jgi:nitric oxide dioxygenase
MSPDISGLPPSIPLTDEQMRLVKSTAPILKEHGPAITRRFYGDMLEAQPELKSVFNHSSQLVRPYFVVLIEDELALTLTFMQTGHQAEALASAVYAYAEHIDNLGPIIPVVDRINQKHASLHIEPPQYAVVGQFLLQAITAVLGADVFAGALYDAWAAAYWQLAHVFIEREATLYAQAGWVGWKPFVVQKRVQESDDIVSFYLIPKEDAPKMGLYRPGQFISVRKFITELGVYQSRQYGRCCTRFFST